MERRAHRPNRRCGGPCLINFVTCAESRIPPNSSFRGRIILHIDAASLHAPPRHIQYQYNGTSREFQDLYFSNPHIAAKLKTYAAILREKLARLRSNECTVLVTCKMGVHRSVAVAGALVEEVEDWEELDAETAVEHLSLRSGWRRVQERARHE